MSKQPNPSQSTNCFIIMPIADHEGYDKGHFNKVYEDIIKPACLKANFHPVRADEVKQTNLIHLDILQKLIESPMAICDLSTRNPNVLFELGLRQAFDKPTVLIQECGTPKIFDISPLRYTEYRKELRYRDVLEDQDLIAESLRATKEATDKGEGVNSIVSLLSLSNPASLRDVTDNDTAKMMQVIMSEMNDLRTDFRRTMRKIDEREHIQGSSVRYESSFEALRASTRRFHSIASRNVPLDVLKNEYDMLQDRFAQIAETSLPISMRNQFKNMQIETEYIFTNALKGNVEESPEA
jgi:hypothetical protein